MAPNKFLAKIASDWNKPDGLCVIRPHQVEAFLTPLPVGRLPGVGKVMEAKLAVLGITTVGELRPFALPELEQALLVDGADACTNWPAVSMIMSCSRSGPTFRCPRKTPLKAISR